MLEKFSGVLIKKIEKVGNYAVRISFSDGHNTGIYSWDFLYEIGIKSQNFISPIANIILCFLRKFDLLNIFKPFSLIVLLLMELFENN